MAARAKVADFRTGSPKTAANETAEMRRERFMRFVMKVVPDECWLWQGCRDAHGYGQFGLGGGPRQMLAHRAAWEIFRGLIPAGMCVMHVCDNPPCVNPDHLSLGSHAENMADARSKGRVHPGEKHGMAKLNETQVREILASGDKTSELALRFGVSHSSISRIRNGVGWRHLRIQDESSIRPGGKS